MELGLDMQAELTITLNCDAQYRNVIILFDIVRYWEDCWIPLLRITSSLHLLVLQCIPFATVQSINLDKAMSEISGESLVIVTKTVESSAYLNKA